MDILIPKPDPKQKITIKPFYNSDKSIYSLENCLNQARICLFTRFRVTALPTALLTVTPRRSLSCSESGLSTALNDVFPSREGVTDAASNTKCRLAARRPCRATRLKSRWFRSRRDRGRPPLRRNMPILNLS